MLACESKLVSRSSRKATVAKTVLIGQAQVLRSYAKPSSRVSNLKYESVRIGSKTVVFIRANPGKKETTDGLGSHVISFGIGVLFRKW